MFVPDSVLSFFILVFCSRVFGRMSESEENNLISVDFEIFGYVQGMSLKLLIHFPALFSALRLKSDLGLNLELLPLLLLSPYLEKSAFLQMSNI